ncbi:MAG: S1C family serine protease [Actinomycetota bacterium]|nr:S1C family serine protease [Actinomycetota bacterium]
MTFEELGKTLRAVADRVGPSVVGVGQRWGVGSGISLGEGKILTNAHNVRREEVSVTLADGATVTGTVAGADVDKDVAVVKVEDAGPPALQWAPTLAEVGIGSPVFALSNPGGRGLRVTHGFVSGTERSFRGPRGRRISGSIEHTAPLLPGSSGGPVVDLEGRLLGLNTNRLGEGFYLAIPADSSLRDRAAALAGGRVPTRPRLGVGLAPADVANGLRRAVGLPERDGLLIRAVEEGGPAASAGVKEGDLLVAADGKAIKDFDGLFDALEGADKELRITIVRGVDEQDLVVPLESVRS